ncbi:MAG: hypothetical protein ILP19_00155 [Oscillospiraceae bacterium]|nr:hypothetical protein [Oscillospiraceae bacterium]
MIRIYAADVTVLSDTRIYESLYKSLPQSRRDKADRYRFASDRYLSLGAGALLKTALESIALDIADVNTDEIGRPYIDGAYFSLSHSGKYALCALSDSCIGADTEQVREFGDTLARRVFSDD